MTTNEARVEMRREKRYALTEELATVCNEFAGAWRDGSLERADVDIERLFDAAKDAKSRLRTSGVGGFKGDD